MKSGPRYFAATIVGFAFAQFVGSSAGTIARALLFVNSFLFRDGGPLREYQVEETTLHVIYVATGSAATIAYAGLFGALFYEDGAEVSAVAGFLGFSALPGVVGLVTFVAGRSTRRESGDDGVGWPVAAWFWRWLPLGLGVGLGAVALWGLAPLGRQPADAPVFVLVACHGLNGLCLGTALRAMPFAFGLMPDEGRS